MAEIEPLIKTDELKTSIWKTQVEKKYYPTFRYDERVDVLILLFVPPGQPTIAHYIDDHVALLYLQDEKEVVGLRVEAFERSFLPKYSNLQNIWRLRDNCDLKDFGDLIISVRRNEPVIAKELSSITHRIAEKRGLELPIPA